MGGSGWFRWPGEKKIAKRIFPISTDQIIRVLKIQNILFFLAPS